MWLEFERQGKGGGCNEKKSVGTNYIGIERLVKKSGFIPAPINNLEGVQCRESGKIQVTEDNWLLYMGLGMVLGGGHFRARVKERRPARRWW